MTAAASALQFTIKRYAELESTNSFLREMAEEGAAEGLVIQADHQTGGRGKPGRKWVSPKGKNLLFSILLRPPVIPAKAPMITQIACRSVAAVLEAHGIQSTFKRPNDVMIGDKKICGVLVESITTGGALNSVIVGIGLNVNAETNEMVPEAISMKEIKGQDFDTEKILEETLLRFKKDLGALYSHSA